MPRGQFARVGNSAKPQSRPKGGGSSRGQFARTKTAIKARPTGGGQDRGRFKRDGGKQFKRGGKSSASSSASSAGSSGGGSSINPALLTVPLLAVAAFFAQSN